jgi:hypothetical protein
MIDFIDWFAENFSSLRRDFEEYLIEIHEYPRHVAENCDDWRDEYCEHQYTLYCQREQKHVPKPV